MMERKRRAAYHEAGYAVVAWALALPITSICIADSESGHRIRKADHLTAMEQVALCYAGLPEGPSAVTSAKRVKVHETYNEAKESRWTISSVPATAVLRL